MCKAKEISLLKSWLILRKYVNQFDIFIDSGVENPFSLVYEIIKGFKDPNILKGRSMLTRRRVTTIINQT